MKRSNFLWLPLLLVVTLSISPGSNAQIITTVAGVGLGDDSMATHAEILGPVAVTMDRAGNTYIAQQNVSSVRKINTAGTISTFAGTGTFGYSGDGGPATAAEIGVIYGIASDTAGNVYIVDQAYAVVRKISTSGIITTVAGNGMTGYSGDGGPATAATMNNPIDVVVDKNNNLVVTDWLNNVVRKIDTAGIITTIVGDGYIGSTGNHGPATASELGRPFRVTVDKQGNLYVAEVIYQCICRVDTAGTLDIIADSTGTYSLGTDGDGGPALSATMTSPCGLALDTSGHLYFSDIGNARIRVIDLNTGTIANYAGSGTVGGSGNGGLATAAQLSYPEGLACDSLGNLLICDPANNEIRIVNGSGIISAYAGQNGFFGDGQAAANAELGFVSNIITDPAGNVYFSDRSNNRVRMIDVSTGIINTVAGNGIAGYNGDGGAATNAALSTPTGLVRDAAGNLYIADEDNNVIRKVDASGIISTYAGSGASGFSGDGGAATNAKMYYPSGIALDNAGNLYIADELNNRVRKVNTSGVISTIAGTGANGFFGDGGLAILAKLSYPYMMTADNAGNIYVSDYGNDRVRRIDTAGIISTFVGSGAYGYSGDGGPASAAKVADPAGIGFDASGNFYVADYGNNVCRYVNSSGIIHTVAGNGTAGFSGDGGPATAAMMFAPNDVTIDPSGNLYVADYHNFRIRKVTLPFLTVPPVPNVFNGIHIFPNPAQDNITIENAGNGKVAISDLAGRLILQTSLSAQKQTVSMRELSAGIYIVSIVDDRGKTRNFKIAKR